MWTTAGAVSAAFAALLLDATAAHENGLARSPQMGWNSWNTFACNINETIMLTAAKKIKDLGLQKYGYHYIVMDDCWSLHERNATGYLQYDPKKFPRGIKALVDDIHKLGFGWGMYSDAGKYTCGRYPGSLGHETKDANLFASWGVDYLKYDNCYNEGQSGTPLISYNRYKVMSDALNKTGRPILYGICNWGEDGPWNWATTIANSWRMSGDIIDNFDRYDDRCPCETFDCALAGHRCSVMNIINKAAPLGQKAGPGRWNDLDSLEVGRPGLTYEEQKLHMTIWAMVKSPLIMGHDVLHTDERTLEILTNEAILDINQNSKWKVGIRNYKRGDEQMWSNANNNGSIVVCLLNSGKEEKTMTADFGDIFLDDNLGEQTGGTYKATDLWTGKTVSDVKRKWTVKVKAHSVAVVRLDPVRGGNSFEQQQQQQQQDSGWSLRAQRNRA